MTQRISCRSAEARSPRITTGELVPIGMTKGHGDGQTSGSYTRKSEEQRGVTSGQATKSTRGMPWHQEPMKDVTNCDKLRGAVSRRYIRRFPNGAIRQGLSPVIVY